MPKIKLSKNFINNVCKLTLNEDLYPSGDITSNLLRNDTKEILMDIATIEKARKSVERMAEIGR